ncbi:hypothetical protein BOX15_Mlig003569g1 [Macrostomum lignano]|uniref:Uncharacterized protein n=2 Tax=Macrostomum lignano TaxID=282301 RepID=A0A267DIR8_9PLAT|nr:hypothetical protein BOX15_Mlig005268g2 [Macrostomum lignano]PAA57368.1 hypothetical protein BOX15_Mlig003569g1 [Macrostomum lignano]
MESQQNGHAYESDAPKILCRVSSGDSSSSASNATEMNDCHDSRPHSPVLPIAQYRPLISRINRRIEKGKRWFSCEFFPPRTASGAVNLLSKFDRFAKGRPLFCDVTWHPAGNPMSDAPTSSIMVASAMLNYSGIDTMLHVTCVGLPEERMTAALERAKGLGLKNILALRGDLPEAPEDGAGGSGDVNNGDLLGDFKYAVDLVRFIRKRYGSFFNICVAGYPTGHPEASSYADDLLRLKEKVDAGADFIITQLFFEADTFLKFQSDCRQLGIRCPIIPGVLPIQAYQSLRHIVKLSKLAVPDEIIRTIEPIKENDEAIRNYGIFQCTQLCRKLLESGEVHGIHFYTLNREVATIEILRNIGLWHEDLPRPLPWKHSANHERCGELVRPVFWSNRPTSYVHRTLHWEEFPNGRWGRPDAPAFGELKDYYLFYLTVRATKKDRLNMWGEQLASERDVWRVFVNFVSGEPNANGFRVTRLPWSDEELQQESRAIRDQLVALNSRGVLTINSQPNVNGLPSGDSTYGWGGPGGYVYQKAYLEFFLPGQFLAALEQVLDRFSPRVNYQIVNREGTVNRLNFSQQEPIALTWGVFPASEIIQPTVCDNGAFMAWKDEAFGLWTQEWANLYPEGSDSRRIIQGIAEDYLLVTLVDNEFPAENCLWSVVEQVLTTQSQQGALV